MTWGQLPELGWGRGGVSRNQEPGLRYANVEIPHPADSEYVNLEIRREVAGVKAFFLPPSYALWLV